MTAGTNKVAESSHGAACGAAGLKDGEIAHGGRVVVGICKFRGEHVSSRLVCATGHRRQTLLTHVEARVRPGTFWSHRVSVPICGGIDNRDRAISSEYLLDCFESLGGHEVLSHEGDGLVANSTKGCDAGKGSEGHESEMGKHRVKWSSRE